MPFFGIPNVWKNYIVSLSGIVFLFIHFLPVILVKLKKKNPAKRRVRQTKELKTSSPVEDGSKDLRFNTHNEIENENDE